MTNYEIEKTIDRIQQSRQRLNPNERVFVLPPNESRKDVVFVENIGELGRGQYGIVYEIVYNGKLMALKVVNKGSDMTSDVRETILNEMEKLNELKKRFPKSNSYLLCYYDISEDKDRIYLVSEKMDGDLLKILLNEKYCSLPLDKKAELIYQVIIPQILGGLKTLHSIAMLHRDIKPENILVRNDVSVVMKLGDFGLSCYIDKCKGKVGSMNYVSPFVLLSKTPTWTTSDDLYSVGCIIYECLTCEPYMYDSKDDDPYSLRNKLRQIQDSGLDFLENGKKIYEKNFNSKMDELYNQIMNIEKQNGKKYPNLRKIYDLCSRLLDPTNENIYSVDDVQKMLK